MVWYVYVYGIHLLLLLPVGGPPGVGFGGLCFLPANPVAAVGVCGRGAVLLDRGKECFRARVRVKYPDP